MQRVWPLALRLPGLSLPLSFPAVTGLGQPPVPLVRGNADAAQDYYCGRFLLAGIEAVAGPEGILASGPPDEAWSAAFHGFAWLADLEAAGLELHKAFARRLIDSWAERRRGLPRAASRPLVAARRLMSFIAHAPYLMRGASLEFHARYCRMLTVETANLAAAMSRLTLDEDRLATAIALAHACAGLRGPEGFAPKAYGWLEVELDQQILADGGHVSRNPSYLLDLLLDLLPLKQSLEAQRRQVPPRLNVAVERMLPMLRLLSHGDGGLATFQGVARMRAGEIRAVLDSDTVGGRPLSLAPQSGYARLQQGSAAVIADAGGARACIGPLALEFSDGPSRIVVNCGLPASSFDDAAARRAAAHSTASFEEGYCEAPGAIARFFGRNEAKPIARPQAEVSHTPEGSLFRGVNAGAAPGIAHERRLYLAARGYDLRGEDRFVAMGGADTGFAVRFHLHPSVKAIASKDGSSISLATPNRGGWRFSVRGGRLCVEDSYFFPGTARRSKQIVITGSTAATPRINWAFKRIEKREGGKQKAEETPSLPF